MCVRTAVSVQSLQSAQSVWADRGHRHPQVREIPLQFIKALNGEISEVHQETDAFDMV